MSEKKKEVIDFSQYTGQAIEFSDWYDIIYEFSFQLGAMVILSILVLYTLLKTPVKFYIKFLTIPLIFFLFYSTIVKLNNILGYAHPAYPTGKVILHDGYRAGDTMELWVQHIGEPRTRLYKVPYSRQLQEEVRSGKEAKQRGNPLVIEFFKKFKRSDGGESNKGTYKTYRLRQLTEKTKKDYE